MKKVLISAFCGALCILALFACETPPGPGPAKPLPVDPAPTTVPAPTEDSVEAMKVLYKNALDAFDANQYTESIKSYVAMLAMFDAMRSPGAEAEDLAAKADTALTKIGTGLSLEPSSEWLDPAGNQIAQSTRSLALGKGAQPSVYFYANYGFGKVAVRDASIAFVVAKGSASLIARVSTDADGKANTTVSKVDKTTEELVIRASPVFVVRGFVYQFKSVYRDFVYLPPVNSAVVFTLARSPLGASASPVVADKVSAAIKPLGLECSAYDGSLDPSLFDRVVAGDEKAMAELIAKKNASYYVIVLVDCAEAIQSTLKKDDGTVVKYDIWSAKVSLTIRIVRQDGSILATYPLSLSDKGQGKTADIAYDSAYKLAAASAAAEISKRSSELRKAFAAE
jgi:hypothetical protein